MNDVNSAKPEATPVPQPEPARKKARPRGATARRSMKLSRDFATGVNLLKQGGATSDILTLRQRFITELVGLCDLSERLLEKLPARLDDMTPAQQGKLLMDALGRLSVSVDRGNGDGRGSPLINLDLRKIGDLLAAGEQRTQAIADLEAKLASLRARLAACQSQADAAPSPGDADGAAGGKL